MYDQGLNGWVTQSERKDKGKDKVTVEVYEDLVSWIPGSPVLLASF